MPTRWSVQDAKANLSDLLGLVCDQIPVVIEQNGQPIAVVITPDQWKQYVEIVQERFFEAVDHIQEQNWGADPEEVERLVTRVVEEVRREHYEKQQHESTRGD